VPAISQDKIDKIVEMYNAGHSLGAICKALRVGGGTAHRYASQNCKMRGIHDATMKHSWPQAFSTVTEDSAYWAGFLMADGSISKPQQNRLQNVSIMLSNRDYRHIQKFMDYVCCDGKISVIKSNGFKGRGHKDGDKNFLLAAAKVSSNQICSDLAAMGVVPNKTKISQAGESVAMNRHFWRGCIDGDGTLMLGHVGRIHPVIKLCGTPGLIEQFGRFVLSAVGHSLSIEKRTDTFCVGRLSGEKAIELVKHLYLDCTVALDRKQDIALAILSLNYKADFRSKRKNLFSPDGQAWCGLCKCYKPTGEFSKAKSRANGLSPRCRSCASIKGKEQYLRVREVKNKKRMERYYRERSLKNGSD
jgi:hypothetical protein